MAELVANKVADNTIKVTYQLQDVTKLGYANTLYMNLNVDKLKSFGWKPTHDLVSMFKNMIQSNTEKTSIE